MPGVGGGNRFAVWGHSQGGQASLYTGLLVKSYAPELNLVGVAAAAPATELVTLMGDDFKTTGGKNLTAMTLWSWSRVFGASINKVVVPEAIPPERLERYGARGKLRRYPGLKEEYELADFEPDDGVLGELGLDAAQPLAVVRTPPSVSLYHRFENDVFASVLQRLRGTQTVVLPRVAAQRAQLDGFIVPEQAIDAQSLVALADLVISAGGTMNREAVALGTPVWTTFEGRMGAVDERLIAEGRLRRLHDAGEIDLHRREHAEVARVRRDPADLVDLLTSPLGP